MSKRKQPPPPANASTGPVTADSSYTSVLREKIKVQMEILRRQDYQDLLRLQSKLAALPPVPPPHEPPANED